MIRKIFASVMAASLVLSMLHVPTVVTTAKEADTENEYFIITKEEVQTETFYDMGWVQDKNAQQFLNGSLVTWRWTDGKKKGRIIGEKNVWNQKDDRLWKYVTLSHDCLKEKIKGKKRVASMCEGMDGKLYLLCKGKETDKVYLIVAKANGKILKAKSISLQPLLKRENGKSVKKWKCGDMCIVDKDTVAVSYTSHTADMTRKKDGVWFIKLNNKKTTVLELENGYLWKLGDGVAYGEKEETGKDVMVVDLETQEKQTYLSPESIPMPNEFVDDGFDGNAPLFALTYIDAHLYLLDVYGNLYVLDTKTKKDWQKYAVPLDSGYHYMAWRIRTVVVSEDRKKLYAFYQEDPENDTAKDFEKLVAYNLEAYE